MVSLPLHYYPPVDTPAPGLGPNVPPLSPHVWGFCSPTRLCCISDSPTWVAHTPSHPTWALDAPCHWSSAWKIPPGVDPSYLFDLLTQCGSHPPCSGERASTLLSLTHQLLDRIFKKKGRQAGCLLNLSRHCQIGLQSTSPIYNLTSSAGESFFPCARQHLMLAYLNSCQSDGKNVKSICISLFY